MTARPVQSLRVRLVLGLSLTICLVWSGVAIWQFTNMQRELRTLLDDRLIASARMVVGIVQQFQQAELAAAPRASNDALLSVIGRDGVACEVSLVRSEVDILTLTATPIPRTLNMAVSGMRDLSIIATPPARRLAVRTFVMEQQNAVITEALLRELLRGGQVYYLHNDVKTIEKCAADLAELVPEARIGSGHGQMHERELERVMSDF